MNTPTPEDQLARKLVSLLGREPDLPADICTRLEYARQQALARRVQVVAAGQGSAAVAPWWLQHMWLLVTTASMGLCAAVTAFCTAEQAELTYGELSPGWAYHAQAERSPSLELAE